MQAEETSVLYIATVVVFALLGNLTILSVWHSLFDKKSGHVVMIMLQSSLRQLDVHFRKTGFVLQHRVIFALVLGGSLPERILLKTK